MSTTYELKNSTAQAVQKEVIELVLEYTISAAGAIAVEKSDVLLVEGASGGDDLSAIVTSGETLTPANAVADATGIHHALVRVGQPIKEVKYAMSFEKLSGTLCADLTPTAPADRIISETTAGDDDMVFLELDSTVNHTTTAGEYVLRVGLVVE